ncbi:UNVERIFIED_CONTAM: hypothetical protein GTU68_005647 [Idotea baltica]|nr:hypothetical protein [Idotea baltica]
MADELNLNYAHTEIGGRFGGNDTAEFLNMSPSGKVPVLRDRGKVVLESNTIVRYLAQSYGIKTWLPTSAYERSQADRWLDWSIDRLERAFVGVFWGHYRTPSNDRNLDAIAASVIDCENCLCLLSDQLNDQQYLLGANPTVADIATGVFLHRLNNIGLDISMPNNIDKWYQRLGLRPGYRKWAMSDFSELKARIDY